MKYGLRETGDGTGAYSKDKHQPTETSIVNATVKKVKELYPEAVVVKIHGGGYQRAGLPDLYIAVDGISLWVEMKRAGSDTTATQKRFLQALLYNGVDCGTAESPQRVLTMIEEVLKE